MGGSCSKFFESSFKKLKKLGTRETYKGQIHKRGSSTQTSSKIVLNEVRKRSSISMPQLFDEKVDLADEAREDKIKVNNNNNLDAILEVEGHGSKVDKVDKSKNSKKFPRPPTPKVKGKFSRLSLSSIPSWQSSKVGPEEFDEDDVDDESYEDIDENYYTTETSSASKSSRKTDSSINRDSTNPQVKFEKVTVEVHPEPKRSSDFINNPMKNSKNGKNLDGSVSIFNFNYTVPRDSTIDLEEVKSSGGGSSISKKSKKSNLSRKVEKINKQSKYAMSRNLGQDLDFINVDIRRKSKIDILKAHFEEPEEKPEISQNFEEKSKKPEPEVSRDEEQKSEISQNFEEKSEISQNFEEKSEISQNFEENPKKSKPEVEEKPSCTSLQQQIEEICELVKYRPIVRADLVKFVLDGEFKVNQNQIEFASLNCTFEEFTFEDESLYIIPPIKMEIIDQQAGDLLISSSENTKKISDWIFSNDSADSDRRNEFVIGLALADTDKNSIKSSMKNSNQNLAQNSIKNSVKSSVKNSEKSSVKNSEKSLVEGSEKNSALSSAKSSAPGSEEELVEGHSTSSGESEEIYDIIMKSKPGKSKRSSKSSFGVDDGQSVKSAGLKGGASVTEMEGEGSGTKKSGSFMDRIKSSASKSFSSMGGSKSGMGQDSMAGASDPAYPDDIKNMNAAANKTAYAPMAGLKWEAPKSCDSKESCCPIGVWTDLCDFQAQWRIEFDQRYVRRMQEQICRWEECSGCSYDDPCCCPADPCCGNFGGPYGGCCNY